MGASCLSIEDEVDFPAELRAHDAIAFCYPNYASRVPLIMRGFAAKHMGALKGKKLVIFATQWIFSGDAARALCDLFPAGHIEVIYAEHFFMPNNVCNLIFLPKASEKNVERRMKMAERKIDRICRDIKQGIVRKRGFSVISRILGNIQGLSWQGSSRNAFASKGTVEYRAKHRVKVNGDCTACNVCVACCPTRNLENRGGKIAHKNNCTICYRCVNRCPQRAITVFFHGRPRWQFRYFALKGGICTLADNRFSQGVHSW